MGFAPIVLSNNPPPTWVSSQHENQLNEEQPLIQSIQGPRASPHCFKGTQDERAQEGLKMRLGYLETERLVAHLGYL